MSKTTISENKKDVIKDVVNESKDMVGEAHEKEGVFHQIFRGYVPLNLLSDLKCEVEDVKKEKIEAYTLLIDFALRRSKDSVNYLLKGYGKNSTDIKDTKTALSDYEKELKRIEEKEKEFKKIFSNPSQHLDLILKKLNLKMENLEETVLNPFQIDQDGHVPTNVLKRMSEIGLFSLKIPEANGGMGFSQKEYDLVLKALAHISGTILALVSAHSTIGSAPLLMYGTEDQKKKYFSEIAKGQFLVAFGLTEPTSGTDAVGKMKCTAKLSEDGKFWVINGEKIYITNIHRSGIMYLMTKTNVGQDVPIEKMKPTVFIVELPFRISDSLEDIDKKREDLAKIGMKMSKPLDLMMIRGSNQAYITFENFKVPVDSVLGGVEGGSKVIFNGLNKGRAGFGASSAEACKFIFQNALIHTTQREMFKVFGGRQCDLPLVKKYISKMAMNSSALEVVSDYITALIENHHDMNIIAECAAIKVLATEGNWETANLAMRLWGGTGTMKGHPGSMEVCFRDAWIGIIVEGVNEAMKQLVTGVGVQSVKNDSDIIAKHFMYLFGLYKPKKKPFKFDLFGSLIPAKLRLALGLIKFEQGKLNFSDALWIQYHTKILCMKTAILGMKYGNNMVVKQLELIKMADIAMSLFSISVILLKISSSEENLSSAKKQALKRFVEISKIEIQKNLSSLNLKNEDDIKDQKVADLWIKELAS